MMRVAQRGPDPSAAVLAGRNPAPASPLPPRPTMVRWLPQERMQARPVGPGFTTTWLTSTPARFIEEMNRVPHCRQGKGEAGPRQSRLRGAGYECLSAGQAQSSEGKPKSITGRSASDEMRSGFAGPLTSSKPRTPSSCVGTPNPASPRVVLEALPPAWRRAEAA